MMGLGTAQAASEGTVGGADLSVRPLLRVAELLENLRYRGSRITKGKFLNEIISIDS